MLGLVRPKAVMPVHGEFRMLAAHGRLAQESGVPADSIVLTENGTVVELSEGRARIVDQIESGVTFVDGLGVGDVRDVALRDRRTLSEDGVIARGLTEPGPLLEEMRDEADRVLRELMGDNVREIKLLQEHLHDAVGQLIYDRTGRRPMILPVIVEV
jgi:ribonuclease J